MVGGGGPSPLGYYLRSLLSACVPLFFFVSGSLYSGRSLGLSQALSKVLHLVLPFCVWAVLAGLFFRWVDGEQLSLKWVVLDAVTLRQQVANWLWFIPTISAVYLFAPICLYIQRNNVKLFKWMIVLLLLFSVGINFISLVCGTFDLLTNSEFGSKLTSLVSRYSVLGGNHPEAFTFFALGAWVEERGLAKKIGSRAASITLLLAPIPLAAYGILSHIKHGATYDVTWNGYSTIGTALVVISLYVLAQKISLKIGITHSGLSKEIALIGGCSFAVYILHWFLRPIAEWCSDCFGFVRLGPISVCLLAFSVLAVVLTAHIGNWIRKTPLRVVLP